MDVLVLGTGALGSALAARLSRAAPVTIAGSWRAALDAVARDGIAVEEGDARWTARVATAPLADAPPSALVVIATKSHQTAAVAPLAARALVADGVLLSLQNGMGHQEALVQAAGASRVACGVTTMGATLLGPGAVRIHPGETTIASTPTGAERAARLFSDAGLSVRLVPDIVPAQWRKLAINCAINPLTALHRIPNGALLQDRDLRLRMEQAAREVEDVARVVGVVLEGDAVHAARDVARRTEGNRSSMLQDVERGVTTEIDDLCGFVVREGARVGVPTPVNEALWRAVAALGPARVEARG